MSKKQIKEKLDNAIKYLFKNQKDIFKFTEESGATEWNLAHHLAFEIQNEFPDYQHDIELTKHSYENRRPDIIIHKRGTHKCNILVIEVKCQNSIDDDIDKIHNHWFTSPLCYTFGAAIRIDNPRKYNIKVFRNMDKLSIVKNILDQQ